MWLVAIGTVYFLLRYQIKKEASLPFKISVDDLQNLFLYLIPGVLLGGRLGYVFFYNFAYFLNNPLEIFLPIQFSGYGFILTGFYGMSFYGGLLGAFLAGFIFSRKRRVDFWKMADWLVLFSPVGYFFGRLGNFLNGELYGRVTDRSWGMYFLEGGPFLRHPSQLYEAFFEGLVLFGILWFLRKILDNRLRGYYFPGALLLIYICSYSLFRFFLEFFREPDVQGSDFFWLFTKNQVLSVFFLAMAIGLGWYFQYRHKNAII